MSSGGEGREIGTATCDDKGRRESITAVEEAGAQSKTSSRAQ